MTDAKLDRRIFHLKGLILSDLKRQWTNSEMAKVSHISPPHLQYLFKKHLSVTPNAFLINARLEKAAELLLTTDFLIVKEVGFEVGFTSDSHFTRTFKIKYGFTPTEFRKRYWDSKQLRPTVCD